MATSARNVQVMARKGMLPAQLRGERGAEATPAPALLFSSCCILLLTPFAFSELVELNMALCNGSSTPLYTSAPILPALPDPPCSPRPSLIAPTLPARPDPP